MLQDVYLGSSGVLTGSARAAEEAKDLLAEAEIRSDIGRRQRELERKRALALAQIAALEAGIEAEEDEMKKIAEQEENRASALEVQRADMALRRHADLEVADETR